jgi:hypothetical protein
MLRALPAHPQEALHKRHVVYCVRLSVGSAMIAVIQFTENQEPLHASSIARSSSGGAPQTALTILRAYNVSWHSRLIYARNIPSAVCLAPPEDERVMLESCRGS